LFKCSPDQIGSLVSGVNENTVVYIGPWNPTTYEKIRQYPNIKHIYEKFPNKKVFFKEIAPDSEITSVDTAIKKLEAEGHKISDYSRDMLTKVNWQEKLKSSYEIVSFSVGDLFADEKTHTYAEIKAKARELDLDLVPQSLVPSIRLNFDENGEWTLIAIEAIRDRDDRLSLFFCNRRGAVSWLDDSFGHDDDRWNSGNRFCFVRK
jgi:hypothetical protein